MTTASAPAVHRRHCDRRLRHPGDDVFGQDPAERLRQADLLASERPQGGADAVSRLFDRDHHAAS